MALPGANLTVGNFTRAIDLSAVSAVDSWKSFNEGIISDLSSAHDGMNNHSALLHGANFSGVNLLGSIFNYENDALDTIGWEEDAWSGSRFHYIDRPHFLEEMVHDDQSVVIVIDPATLPLLALCVLRGW